MKTNSLSKRWRAPAAHEERGHLSGFHGIGRVCGRIKVKPIEAGGRALVPQKAAVDMVYRGDEAHCRAPRQLAQHLLSLPRPQPCMTHN